MCLALLIEVIKEIKFLPPPPPQSSFLLSHSPPPARCTRFSLVIPAPPWLTSRKKMLCAGMIVINLLPPAGGRGTDLLRWALGTCGPESAGARRGSPQRCGGRLAARSANATAPHVWQERLRSRGFTRALGSWSPDGARAARSAGGLH